MPDCPSCGSPLVRTHRRAYERIVFAEAFRCRECGSRRRRAHPPLRALGIALRSRHSRCFSCGSDAVHPSSDRAPATILDRLLRAAGARPFRCRACQATYLDWRAPLPEPPPGNPSEPRTPDATPPA